MARPTVESASPVTVKPIKARNLPKGWIYGAKYAEASCEARVCLITVAAVPSTHWAYGLLGQTRKAIEVTLDKGKIYLDNENGAALQIFLRGLAPLPGMRWLPAYTVADDPASAVSYKATPSLP